MIMKKLLLLLAIVLISCDDRRSPEHSTKETLDYGTCVVELSVRSKTHEYLIYQTGSYGAVGGMVHLPECKYCNEE